MGGWDLMAVMEGDRRQKSPQITCLSKEIVDTMCAVPPVNEEELWEMSGRISFEVSRLEMKTRPPPFNADLEQ